MTVQESLAILCFIGVQLIALYGGLRSSLKMTFDGSFFKLMR